MYLYTCVYAAHIHVRMYIDIYIHTILCVCIYIYVTYTRTNTGKHIHGSYATCRKCCNFLRADSGPSESEPQLGGSKTWKLASQRLNIPRTEVTMRPTATQRPTSFLVRGGASRLSSLFLLKHILIRAKEIAVRLLFQFYCDCFCYCFHNDNDDSEHDKATMRQSV